MQRAPAVIDLDGGEIDGICVRCLQHGSPMIGALHTPERLVTAETT